MDSWFIKLITNSGWLFLLLGGLAVIFHVFFLWFLKIDKKGRAALDYLILVFAALSIIPISADIRGVAGQARLREVEIRAITNFQLFRDYFHPRSTMCRKFTRISSSPDNFDEIQADNDRACNWHGKAMAILPMEVSKDLPELNLPEIPKLNGNDPSLEGILETYQMYIDNYESYRQKAIILRKKIKKNDFESIIYILSPLFLCITFALGATKITSSLRSKDYSKRRR